ncbi:DNA-3-methyladenine glycosylase 2 family protein [Ammoniphilus sp. CFH 90114]|nr:DNA-3-methyladenine glycosylase 2 family protein [Ammoniphilus sp. CFH 90114]
MVIKVYDEKVQRIAQADARLGQLIAVIGDLTIPLRVDPFDSLVMSIIGQLLSVKAAGTIYTRFVDLCKVVAPESILLMEDTEFRAAGLSRSKTSYIKDLSSKVISKEVDLYQLDQFSNETVIRILTSVKGVGKWTAEMFLIFSLGRLDVLSLGDVGLQRSAKWLYNLDKHEDGKACLERKASLWFPYYTIASLYLWEAVNMGYVDSCASLEELLL